MICEPCRGLGYVKAGEWPKKCPTCKGHGHLTKHAVAKALGVHPSTLTRMERGKSRVSTCERVLELLAKLP